MELRELLRRKPNPIAYDGFEPSGRMHIAQVGGSTGGRAHTHRVGSRLTCVMCDISVGAAAD